VTDGWLEQAMGQATHLGPAKSKKPDTHFRTVGGLQRGGEWPNPAAFNNGIGLTVPCCGSLTTWHNGGSGLKPNRMAVSR
jgi:hypothetical protein